MATKQLVDTKVEGAGEHEAALSAGDGSGGLGLWHWAAWFGVLLLFYVLSVGPVVKVDLKYDLRRTHPRIDGALEAIYTPIMFVIDRSHVGQRCFIWYLRVWGVPIQP